MKPQAFGRTVLALAMAVLTAMVTVSSASGRTALVAQLAGLAIVIVAAGLIRRSGLVAGAATLPMLGAGLLEAASADDLRWVRALVIGCLWYLTLEIAWDAIERTDGAIRTAAANAQRVQEWATVVVAAALVVFFSMVAASLAPARTLVVQALLILGSLAGLVVALRNLAKSAAN